jgi:tetratricopeptide (TPR) repeat protein
VQLSANLVSAMGLVVQSVAQLKSIPTLPSDVTPLLGTLDAALDPIRDVLPKIQSLKNVIGGTPILSELNKLAGEGPELANRLLEAVDRLDEALSQLPDAISDGAAFRMPVAITGAMAELSRTLDEVSERVEALPAGPQKVVLGKALGQAREALGPIQKALPAVQRLVGFLIDALNLKSLVTDEMLTALQDKVIKGLNDAIGKLTNAADAEAKAALTKVKAEITKAVRATPSIADLDLVKLLGAFDDLKKALVDFGGGALKDVAATPDEAGDSARDALANLVTSLPGRPMVGLNGNDLNIGFEFELSRELKDFKLDFDLNAGDVIPVEFKTGGTVNLRVGGLMDFDFGVDLGRIGADPSKVLEAVFLRDTTKLNLNAFAAVDNFSASASVGGIDLVQFGPAGNPGKFAFKKDISDAANKDAAFIQLELKDNSDGNVNGKIALSSFSFSNFKLTSAGQLQLSVPIKIGTALVMKADGVTVDPLTITLGSLTDFGTCSTRT